MAEQLPPAQRDSLIEVADNLADIQSGIHYVIELGQRRNKETLSVSPVDPAQKHRSVANRLEAIGRHPIPPGEPQVAHEDLIEGLLQVADNAEQLTAQAAKIEDIPLPMRAGITDRLVQVTCLLRLLAHEVDNDGLRRANIPMDA